MNLKNTCSQEPKDMANLFTFSLHVIVDSFQSNETTSIQLAGVHSNRHHRYPDDVGGCKHIRTITNGRSAITF